MQKNNFLQYVYQLLPLPTQQDSYSFNIIQLKQNFECKQYKERKFKQNLLMTIFGKVQDSCESLSQYRYVNFYYCLNIDIHNFRSKYITS